MAKSRSQPVNLPGAQPLMNPLLCTTKPVLQEKYLGAQHISLVQKLIFFVCLKGKVSRQGRPGTARAQPCVPSTKILVVHRGCVYFGNVLTTSKTFLKEENFFYM